LVATALVALAAFAGAGAAAIDGATAAVGGAEATLAGAGGGADAVVLAAFDQRGTRTRRMKMLAAPMIETTTIAIAIQRRFMGALRSSAPPLSIQKVDGDEQSGVAIGPRIILSTQ
jgi:hypothetical protein